MLGLPSDVVVDYVEVIDANDSTTTIDWFNSDYESVEGRFDLIGKPVHVNEDGKVNEDNAFLSKIVGNAKAALIAVSNTADCKKVFPKDVKADLWFDGIKIKDVKIEPNDCWGIPNPWVDGILIPASVSDSGNEEYISPKIVKFIVEAIKAENGKELAERWEDNIGLIDTSRMVETDYAELWDIFENIEASDQGEAELSAIRIYKERKTA